MSDDGTAGHEDPHGGQQASEGKLSQPLDKITLHAICIISGESIPNLMVYLTLFTVKSLF